MSKYNKEFKLAVIPKELMQELEYRRVETDYLKKLEALAQQKYLASKNKSK
jgi:transposase